MRLEGRNRKFRTSDAVRSVPTVHTSHWHQCRRSVESTHAPTLNTQFNVKTSSLVITSSEQTNPSRAALSVAFKAGGLIRLFMTRLFGTRRAYDSSIDVILGPRVGSLENGPADGQRAQRAPQRNEPEASEPPSPSKKGGPPQAAWPRRRRPGSRDLGRKKRNLTGRPM